MDYNDPVIRRRLTHKLLILLMLVKFHARVDKLLKDEFLDKPGVQANDLLQLWEDWILMNGFQTRGWLSHRRNFFFLPIEATLPKSEQSHWRKYPTLSHRQNRNGNWREGFLPVAGPRPGGGGGRQ